MKYNSHINLEFCASIASVKYLFKYIYKGHDCANIQIRREENQQGQQEMVWDEIKQYLDTRYVSAPVANICKPVGNIQVSTMFSIPRCAAISRSSSSRTANLLPTRIRRSSRFECRVKTHYIDCLVQVKY